MEYELTINNKTSTIKKNLDHNNSKTLSITHQGKQPIKNKTLDKSKKVLNSATFVKQCNHLEKEKIYHVIDKFNKLIACL